MRAALAIVGQVRQVRQVGVRAALAIVGQVRRVGGLRRLRRLGKLRRLGGLGGLGGKNRLFCKLLYFFFGTLIKITYFCKILYLKQNQ